MRQAELLVIERRRASTPQDQQDKDALVREVWRLRATVGRLSQGVMDPQAVAREAFEPCK